MCEEVAEASGGVAEPAAVLFGASRHNLVEPCDELGHVGPGRFMPRRGALGEARPPTVHPRAGSIGFLDEAIRNFHSLLVGAPFPNSLKFREDRTRSPARTGVDAVIDEPSLDTGIR